MTRGIHVPRTRGQMVVQTGGIVDVDANKPMAISAQQFTRFAEAQYFRGVGMPDVMPIPHGGAVEKLKKRMEFFRSRKFVVVVSSHGARKVLGVLVLAPAVAPYGVAVA